MTQVCEKCKVSCFSLSARSSLGRPYRKTQCVVNAMAMSCAVAVRKGTVLVTFEKRFVTSNNAVLPLFDSITGPRMLVLTYFEG